MVPILILPHGAPGLRVSEIRWLQLAYFPAHEGKEPKDGVPQKKIALNSFVAFACMLGL